MRYLEYKAYWEEAAMNNKKIAHKSYPNKISFLAMDIEEILTQTKTDLSSMSLIMENPEIKPFDALSDNPRKMISGGVLIVQEYEKGNFADRDNIIQDTEIVCEQMMAKIYNDAKWTRQLSSYTKKIKGIDLNSLAMNRVSNLFGGFWIGWRLTFTFNQTFTDRLFLKEEDWINETPFAI